MQIPRGISIAVDPKIAHSRIFTLDVPERLLTYSEYPRGPYQGCTSQSERWRSFGPSRARAAEPPYVRPYMAIYDHIYPYMTIYGPYMVIYGYAWSYMAIYGPYMVIYDNVWPIWSCMSMWNHIWLHMSMVKNHGPVNIPNLAYMEIQAIEDIYSTGHRWTIINMKKMGDGGFAAAPHFLDIGYGPSVACIVGCTWLMYSLCMAYVLPIYGLYNLYFYMANSCSERTSGRTSRVLTSTSGGPSGRPRCLYGVSAR